MKDKQGLDVSTDDPEVIEGLNHFVEQVLGYGHSPHALLELADKAPSCALVNALAVYILLSRENLDPHSDVVKKAEHYLQNARNSLPNTNSREKAYIQLAELLADQEDRAHCEKHADKVANMVEDIVEQWPEDLLALKFAHINYFNLGESKSLLRVAKKASNDKSHAYHHYWLGMLAFAEIENGLIEDAERHGTESVRLAHEQRDPWAHHAVAHCMEFTGRIDEGIRWMEGHSHLWDDCGSFMYTHNWWHTCLFYLDREASETVLKLYDEKVWGRCKTAAQDQLGAASLLWRLNIRGMPVADRWDDISEHMEPHVKEHIQPFIDLHYIYALAAAGKDERVQEMLDSLRETSCYARNQKEVALPLAMAAAAHAKGDYEKAFELMDPIISRTKEIGGSDAQQDMFHQTYVDVLLKTKNALKAKSLLEERVKARPCTPYVLRQLAQTHKELGDEETSSQYFNKASHWAQFYACHPPHEIVKSYSNGNSVYNTVV